MASPKSPYLVIGTGPAGAAAAKALVAAGQRVVVIDTGLQLEPEREAARHRLAATTPDRWDQSDVDLIRFAAHGTGGPGYKQLFGSDVAFHDAGVLNLAADHGVGARPSYALGGLSNVWGAGVLPYAERDLEGWPLGPEDLHEFYRAVLEFIPYAAEEDELAGRYPLCAQPDGPLLRSDAGERLLARMRTHTPALTDAGYHFGASRLAVRVGHPAPAAGCVYVGRCLDGCPYGHIYSASQTIEELHRDDLIEYRPGLHVDRILESDGAVTAQATPLDGGPGVRLAGRRAFVAAGAVSTTAILQRSGLLPRRVEIRDSQTLFLPFAWIAPPGRTGREPGHTLAQAFLVLEDPNVSTQPVHISLYTYNDGLSDRARAAHPRIASALGPALETLIRRLVVGICFFHSHDSHRIASVWNEADGSLRLEPVLNRETTQIIRRFQRSLLRSLARIGLVPLSPIAEVAPPGGGYHYGGSVPMRERPRAGDSDRLGRPVPAQRVHVVDSSCFSTVPGSTITLTAMANAYRIATCVEREDQG
jgi:choline dehydrogenase-like flavoprotein